MILGSIIVVVALGFWKLIELTISFTEHVEERFAARRYRHNRRVRIELPWAVVVRGRR